MSEKTRIEKIMQIEGLSSGQFAQEIGIQNSTLSHILNERNKPSLDVMKKILNRYPNIHSDWLILGQGSMFRKELHSQTPTLFRDDDEIIEKSDSYNSNEAPKNDLNNASIQQEITKTEPELINPRLHAEKIQGNFPDNTNTKEYSSQPEKIQTQRYSQSVEYNINQVPGVEKKIIKIILYYSDNTFQEFESK
ncbi:MAG: helix-turn-helix transcriptional regulator [Paludibacter sp.]|nr:helix-turn-helix transcriptional regulator [Paludibacter sp.]MDD4428132.1 helix-turn-helix transcriptional regulator [Paludibacter sp.]